MIDFQYARVATSQEVDKFNSSIQYFRDAKEIFTRKWLTNNGTEFVKMHDLFPEVMERINKEKFENDKKQRYSDYLTKSQIFDELLSSECECGGDNIYIEGYDFIGCSNFREAGFNHTRMGKPNYHDHPYHPYEFNSAYLTKVKAIYNLPKELINNILLEYLIMNGRDSYCQLNINNARDSSLISLKREKLILEILKERCDSVMFKKGIFYKCTNEKEKLIFPDFIAVKKDSCYIIEQKKHIGLIDNVQIDKYKTSVEYLLKDKKITYKVKVLFIIEQLDGQHDNNIISLSQLSTYEFN